eukprot:sb/3472427/
MDDEPYHCLLYSWLLQCDSIGKLRNQINTSKTLQRLILDIETIPLLEFNSLLGNCLIGNYPLFCSMVQDILFEELDDLVTSKNELHVVVRPSSVVHVPDPAPDSNSLVNLWPPYLTLPKLQVNFWGSVVSITTPPQPYTQSTKYRCPIETCKGNNDPAHIRSLSHD